MVLDVGVLMFLYCIGLPCVLLFKNLLLHAWPQMMAAALRTAVVETLG